jgi:hypothetical protein
MNKRNNSFLLHNKIKEEGGEHGPDISPRNFDDLWKANGGIIAEPEDD